MTLLQPPRTEIADLAQPASRAAVLLAEAGLFALAACVLAMPAGLLPFGLCLFLSSLLALRRLRLQARVMGWPLRPLLWLMLAVLALSLCSVLLFEHGFRDVDNRSRFVVLPWVALWAFSLRPRLALLWWGALLGIVAALVLAVVQVAGGAPRADGWTNAIVFADIVLVLMVLLVFCRPPGRWPWLVAGLAAGCGAIVLSGSRGVWPALLLLLAIVVWGARWRDARTRLLILSGAAAIAATLVLTVPGLGQQMRIVELQTDMEKLEVGDVDTSAGARVERLKVAYQTFLAHPLTGVGVGHFDDAMVLVPACRATPEIKRCHLGHAHNDVAEWGATQGVPGVLLLLAVYGFPLWMFVRLYRSRPRLRFRGPAAAGIMLVAGYVLCGMTQSMFAHQVTASFYVVMVGVLAGLARAEVTTLPAAAARPAAHL